MGGVQWSNQRPIFLLLRDVLLMLEAHLLVLTQDWGDEALPISDHGIPRTVVSVALSINSSCKIRVLIPLNFIKSCTSIIIGRSRLKNWRDTVMVMLVPRGTYTDVMAAGLAVEKLFLSRSFIHLPSVVWLCVWLEEHLCCLQGRRPCRKWGKGGGPILMGALTWVRLGKRNRCGWHFLSFSFCLFDSKFAKINKQNQTTTALKTTTQQQRGTKERDGKDARWICLLWMQWALGI